MRTSTHLRRAIVLTTWLTLGLGESAWAGADSRGGLGHLYLQFSYSASSADEGYDNHGNAVSLTDPAFVDAFTSLLASDEGTYDDTVFRVYAEIGLMQDLDAIVSVDWKQIEKHFDYEVLGFSFPVNPESSGFGDVSLGLAWNFLDVPLPLALTGSVRFPTYSTDVDDLNLTDLNSLDDEVPLGQGTTDLLLGISASSGPLLPFGFIDVELGYVLSDLVDRDFSDRFSWLTKIGGSYRGLGAALTASGILSFENGDAPNVISQDFFFDPADRVTILNDQEWLTVGGQLWYAWDGLGIELGYHSTISGRNTVKTDRFSVAIFIQR